MSGLAVTTDEELSRWRADVNRHLQACLERGSDCPPRLHAAMEYSLLAGGKRLRPLLLLMACEACGGRVSAAIPAACAIEMVHTYSLIHDDLPAMDDDDLRRGQPTCHKQFDEATAILAGDALLTVAFEVLASELHPAEVAAACCGDLAAAAGMCGMVGGQMADLEAETLRWSANSSARDAETGPPTAGEPGTDPDTLLARLESIHRRKTGRLLCSALTMGGRIAQASPQILRDLQTYGELVGLAFQITDDLLDVGGNAETMGKGVRKDADAGKLTYPSLLGIEESQARALQLVEAAGQAIESLGDRGWRLKAMAQYIVERER